MPCSAPLDAILEGHLSLINIHVPSAGLLSEAGNKLYTGVRATFCHLEWDLQEADPSKVPMFKDLQQQSTLCAGTLFTVDDFWSLARRARDYDARNHTFVATKPHPDQPQSVPPSMVVFHETRCGSTLVANLLAAAFSPDKAKYPVEGEPSSSTSLHPAARVYSESPPPVEALKACEFNRRCDPGAQSALIRDVFYMMGRSPAVPKASKHYRFYKIQSIGVHSIHAFRQAMPNTPWMFVYRDSVEVIMSHFKNYLVGKQLSNSKMSVSNTPVCLRNYDSATQPQILLDLLAEQHPGKAVSDLSKHDYCAAHLASLAESAVREYKAQQDSQSSSAPPVWFVNYEQLPHIIWERVLPQLLGSNFLTPQAIQRMKEVAHVYSKGRGSKAGEGWMQDSTLKQEKAPDAVKDAAKEYLKPVFDKMEDIRKAEEAKHN